MTREIGRATAQRSLHFPLLLLALLGGLFAMHGLGPHHVDHSSGHGPTALAAVASAVPTSDHSQAAHREPAAGTEDPRPGAPAPDEEGGGLGECLALLGLLFGLILRTLLAARRTRLVFELPRLPEPPLRTGRPPDRPCLHRLSILRC